MNNPVLAAQDSPTLREGDVRAMVHLLGEVAAVEGEHVAKKRFLLRGLCELIGADQWAWVLICDFAAARPPVAVDFLHYGFSEAGFGAFLAAFLRACEHAETAQTNAASIGALREGQAQPTKGPERLPLWEQAQVGAAITALRPASTNAQSLIALCRGLGMPAFTAREDRIAHIVLSEVPWLHEQGWPQARPRSMPQLSPRQRMTLHLLRDGRSRKEIADQLEISTNTVAGYVREVYRFFQVHSHAELLRRLHQRAEPELRRPHSRAHSRHLPTP